MSTSPKFRRILVYTFMSCAMGLWMLLFISYECIRSYGPRQSDVLTGHVYAKRLQQPEYVYLTKLQVEWFDYGAAIPMLPLAVGLYFDSRWNILRPRPYLPKPKKFY